MPITLYAAAIWSCPENAIHAERWQRLTLPSSGPAFGRPLKSNVRRRTSHTPKISASSKSLRPCPEPAQDQSHQPREPIEITSAAAMCHIELLLMKSLPRRCARWSARSRASTLGVLQEQFGARLSLTALPNHRAQRKAADYWCNSACRCFLSRPLKATLRQRTRRLTRPSSGPAYGRPLMSNVRRRSLEHGPRATKASMIGKSCWLLRQHTGTVGTRSYS